MVGCGAGPAGWVGDPAVWHGSELEVFSPLHHALPGALYYRPRVDYTPLGMLIYLFVINVAILILNWEQRDFGLENIITQAS